MDSSNVLCKLRSLDCTSGCDFYLEAILSVSVITCFIGDLQFKEPMIVSLVIEESEIALQGRNEITFSNVVILKTVPLDYAFKGTF
jgi:hypothetical protein